MKTTELLNLQTSAEEAENKEPYSENETRVYTVENTPFKVVKNENKWIIVMREYKVSTQEFNSVEEAEEYIHEKNWELILNSVMAYNEIFKEFVSTNNINIK